MASEQSLPCRYQDDTRSACRFRKEAYQHLEVMTGFETLNRPDSLPVQAETSQQVPGPSRDGACR